jgi:hypothetical protein
MKEGNMRNNRSQSLTKFASLSELIRFFDSHDMSDYWDRLAEADFEINIKTTRHLIAVNNEIIPQLNKVARAKKLPAEKLITVWLRGKLANSKRA